MTVADLIEELKQYDPQSKVIISKDAEGNGFSPVDDTESAFYRAETTWYGEHEEHLDSGNVPAVFIWPIN